MPVSPESQLRSLLSEAPGELLLTHPVLNIPIYRGSDVELFSGDPSKPYVARIEDFKPGLGLKCRWYWRPFLDFGQSAGMPDIEDASGRSLNSYGISELLGGFREDWNPPEAITALVKVLPIEEWLKLHVTLPAKGIYFTRQVYTEGKGCSPDELAKTVLAPDPKGAASSIVPVLHLQVINPEMRVYECQNCHKLYHPHAVQPESVTTEKDYPSQAAISFTCGGCGASSVNLPLTPTNLNENRLHKRDTVNEELNEASGRRSTTASDEELDSPENAADTSRNSERKKKRKSKCSPQSEEKRKQVVDKFYNSLVMGAGEMKAAGLQMKALEIELSDNTTDDKDSLNSLAKRIEEAMYDTHGQSIKSKSYRAAYRTVSFNLSDPQNASLRRRVLTGEMSPHHLVTASPDELGSDSMKKKRLRQQEKYYKSQVLLEKKLRTSSPDRPVVQDINKGHEGQSDNDEDDNTNKAILPPMPDFGLPPSPDKEDLDNIEDDDTEMIDHDDAEENSKDLEDLNLSNESIEEAVRMEVEDGNLAQEEDAYMDDISDDALDELGSIEEDISDEDEEEEEHQDEEGMGENGENDGEAQLKESLLANSETRSLLDEALKDRGDWSLEATATRLKERVEDIPSHSALIDTLRRELCPT